MILRSWCSFCSREYSDKRWLLVEGECIICNSCKKVSKIVSDENDDAYFYLVGDNNGSR